MPRDGARCARCGAFVGQSTSSHAAPSRACAGVSVYVVYYLPFRFSFDPGSGSYRAHFLAVGDGGPRLPLNRIPTDAPLASVTFDSVSEFDRRSPMEMVASPTEIATMLSQASPSNPPYLIWAWQIFNSSTDGVRLKVLPLPLVAAGPGKTSAAVQLAHREEPASGQFAMLQLAVFAASKPIESVEVTFGHVGQLRPSDFTCFQMSGTSYEGAPMQPNPVRVPLGQVGQLLVGINVPTVRCTKNSVHRGNFTVRVSPDTPATSVSVSVHCASAPRKGKLAEPMGTGAWALERMNWLNSVAGANDSAITRPYHPLRQDGSTLECLGRSITIGHDGLPASIISNGRNVLTHPVSFSPLAKSTWVPTVHPKILLKNGGAKAVWQAQGRVKDWAIIVEGSLDYTGLLEYGVIVDPILMKGATATDNVLEATLTVTVPAAIARFAVGAGMGDDGGYCNRSALHWQWNQSFPYNKHVPAGGPVGPKGWRVWVGDVDAGLWLKLKGQTLDWNRGGGGQVAPESWSNGGQGGIRVLGVDGEPATIEAFTGRAVPRRMLFNFSLTATPVKGAYTSTVKGKYEHYVETRHFHVPYGVWSPPSASELQSDPGANVVIIHQSSGLNPYINYPYHPSVAPRLAQYVADGAAAGARVKVYYTVGQLSNHAPELFALAALNGEALLQNESNPIPGPANLEGMGGNLIGNEWLEEHLVTGYEGGWFTMNPGDEEDASVGTNSTSRMLNMYIEGQGYLFARVGVSGLYYDGFDGERVVQQRIRRMVMESKLVAHYDVHGRPFDFTELLPFVDSMWTCEGIDFTRRPDYWLTTIAALPFGTFGEMLGGDVVPPIPGKFCGESCANKWRGMLFGMTNRAGWNGHDPNDNMNLWKFWDKIHIEQADLYGWWNATAPVRLYGSPDVFASSYVRHGACTLVAIASWSTSAESITVLINWNMLGLSRTTAAATAPALKSFNRNIVPTNFEIDGNGSVHLAVPPLQGWLLLLHPNTNTTGLVSLNSSVDDVREI